MRESEMKEEDKVTDIGKWDEGQTKFLEWESDIYGQDTPLSDDDKSIWIEGYLHAKREELT